MKPFFRALLFCLCIASFAKEIETLYGKFTCEEPVILELLESSAMQRLKDVDQHGFSHLSNPPPSFNRYDHSVGVFHILRRFDASLFEQIAGLLHDVSHTAFSHVGDFVFNHIDDADSYQDTIHEWHLKNNGSKETLEKYGIQIHDIAHKNGTFSLLEKRLPDLCADRLEYNLHTGYIFGLLTKGDIETILNDISLHNGTFVFNTPSIARKFSSLSLYFTETLWGADWNITINILTAGSIRRALEIGVLTANEVHLGGDKAVLVKLEQATDSQIISSLHAAKNYKTAYSHVAPEEATHRFKPKFRGINPWVMIEGSPKRLTEIDPIFAKEFDRVREKMRKGYSLKL